MDPTNTKRIYVSYTDFDFSGTSAACPLDFRTAIEFVESDDGGNTWSSSPNVAIEVCGAAAVQGSQLAVNSHGTLYISWVNLGSNFPSGPREIQLSNFTPRGSVSTPVNVSSVTPGGESYYLQGEFRDFLDMAMAVDRSGTPSDGTLYITWADGGNKVVPDVLGFAGTYSYDDVLVSRSFDGGHTWSSPTKVNSDSQTQRGAGHDHFQAGIAVDKTGKVAECWYDRRNDRENFAIRRFCGESTTQGFNWTDADIGLTPFAPTHGIDVFINPIYMGDYDQLTSDFTGVNGGFIGSFESMGARGDPDVKAYPLR
jgi:hypothetical protein